MSQCVTVWSQGETVCIRVSSYVGACVYVCVCAFLLWCGIWTLHADTRINAYCLAWGSIYVCVCVLSVCWPMMMNTIWSTFLRQTHAGSVTQMCVARGFYIRLHRSCAAKQLCGLRTDVNQTGHLKFISSLCPLRFSQLFHNANWYGLFRHVIPVLLKLSFKLLCNLLEDYCSKKKKKEPSLLPLHCPTSTFSQRYTDDDERHKSFL